MKENKKAPRDRGVDRNSDNISTGPRITGRKGGRSSGEPKGQLPDTVKPNEVNPTTDKPKPDEAQRGSRAALNERVLASAFDYANYPFPDTRRVEVVQSRQIASDMSHSSVIPLGPVTDDLINDPTRQASFSPQRVGRSVSRKGGGEVLPPSTTARMVRSLANLTRRILPVTPSPPARVTTPRPRPQLSSDSSDSSSHSRRGPLSPLRDVDTRVIKIRKDPVPATQVLKRQILVQKDRRQEVPWEISDGAVSPTPILTRPSHVEGTRVQYPGSHPIGPGIPDPKRSELLENIIRRRMRELRDPEIDPPIPPTVRDEVVGSEPIQINPEHPGSAEHRSIAKPPSVQEPSQGAVDPGNGDFEIYESPRRSSHGSANSQGQPRLRSPTSSGRADSLKENRQPPSAPNPDEPRESIGETGRSPAVTDVDLDFGPCHRCPQHPNQYHHICPRFCPGRLAPGIMAPILSYSPLPRTFGPPLIAHTSHSTALPRSQWYGKPPTGSQANSPHELLTGVEAAQILQAMGRRTPARPTFSPITSKATLSTSESTSGLPSGLPGGIVGVHDHLSDPFRRITRSQLKRGGPSVHQNPTQQ